MIYAQIMCCGNGEACNDLRINNNFKLTSINTVSYCNSTNCLAELQLQTFCLPVSTKFK